ncbi:MAG: glycoside hydrolase family 2 [Faecalibacterium sp.]|nr:glycoside hydrolase family 2 [Faecalibacterium sp.]
MHPLAEYPRPAMRRDSCEILNGPWQYAITQTAEYPAAWQGSILVPYSPEAPASGVGRTLQPGQWLHYHRLFAPPAGEGGRVLLHFGAVDYACAVQVNGHLAGGHRGGYWPFTLDITDLLNGTGRNSLWVAVQDPTGHGTQARGKQTLKPGGMFYPAQSGIWQTVWLERVPDNYIQTLTVTPDYDARTVTVRVHTAKPGGAVNLWAMVRAGGVTIAEDWGSDEADQDGEVTLNIPEEHFFPWSPDTPFLYDLTVGTNQGEEAEFDTVHSYFALRKWSCAPDAHGVLRFCLNDKPILLNGLLDQGYWPEGLYTPPSDAAVERELSEVKALGFNLLRKHAKIEPQRWYYHCDRLGLIVWQDIVNGGSAYNLWFVTYLTNVLQPLLRRFPDGKAAYSLLSRAKPAGREEYAHELADTVQALRCHPCIACWVPFNEGWGQFDAGKAVQALRTLDGTRLVDEASGWFDQGGGDVHSLHNYFYPLRIRPQKRTVALSEYGGIAWPMPGHEPPRKTYGYGTAKDRQELTARYKKLQLKTVLPQLEKGLSALVYTQLTDVEDEVNGLFTYDRAAVKPDANAVRSVNAALAAEFARVTNPAKK